MKPIFNVLRVIISAFAFIVGTNCLTDLIDHYSFHLLAGVIVGYGICLRHIKEIYDQQRENRRFSINLEKNQNIPSEKFPVQPILTNQAKPSSDKKISKVKLAVLITIGVGCWITVRVVDLSKLIHKNEVAHACADAKEPDAAVSACTIAIDHGPSDNSGRAKLFGYRAAAHVHKKEFDLAINDYTEALRLVPRSIAILSERCLTYTMQSEYEKALADCSAAVAQSPKNPIARVIRGAARAGSRDFEGAAEDLENIDPSLPRDLQASSLVMRAGARLHLHRVDEAMADLDKAIELTPSDADVWAARCDGLLFLGRLAEARGDCDHALAVKPQDPHNLVTRAFLELKAERYGDARADVESALKADGKEPYALYARALLEQLDGNRSMAADDARQAKELKRNIADDIADYNLTLRLPE